MPGFQFEEKRRFPRVNFKSPVRYHVRGEPDFENALSSNISEGGIGFINNKFLAPSMLVMLEINVLSRVLRPVGKIVSSLPLPHSERNRLGIEFVEMDHDDKRYLQNFVNMQV